MKKYKKKTKGTRYVAKVLKKYFGKKYPNYKSALPKAREIAESLRSSGERFTVKNVSSLIRKKRIKPGSKKEAPELFYKLTTPSYYFDLVDFPTYINDTTSEIFFTSRIFNDEDYEIQGGQRQPYSRLFSSYVNYINSIIDSESDDYTTSYMVMATPPEFNKENDRWESQIITVDASGNPQDYDFEPTKPVVEPISKEKIKKIKEKREEKKKETLQKSQAIVEKELELKISKEKSRQQANEMFLKGLLTKKEFKDEINRINNL